MIRRPESKLHQCKHLSEMFKLFSVLTPKSHCLDNLISFVLNTTVWQYTLQLFSSSRSTLLAVLHTLYQHANLKKKTTTCWDFDPYRFEFTNQFRGNWQLNDIDSSDVWAQYITPFIMVFKNLFLKCFVCSGGKSTTSFIVFIFRYLIFYIILKIFSSI